MEKRYQVFVSSTYSDLLMERQEVMQALLELDCIPSGMELFPATNQSQWDFIKKVIADCDYYIVIVGGRYGSIGPDGQSYTEMEFRYATEIGKPTMAFRHRKPGSIPAEKSEQSDEGRKKLEDFRSLIASKLYKEWETPQELGSVVSRSLVQLKKSEPAIGWVRASDVSDLAETNRLRKRIEELEAELSSVTTAAPKGTEVLAQGADKYSLRFKFRLRGYKDKLASGELARGQCEFITDWDNLASICLPSLQQEGYELQMKRALEEVIEKEKLASLAAAEKVPANGVDVDVLQTDFEGIIIQFRALGYIEPSTRKRMARDLNAYWKLTRFGTAKLLQLRAKRR